MNIEYTKDITKITTDMLDGGFFVGWPNPPDTNMHLRILKNSYVAYAAINTDTHKVIGFINAVSDGVLSAYIPLLEILPKYQGKGIGDNLVRLMLDELEDLYMVDVCHDPELSVYYAKFGAHQEVRASIFRNFHAQSGKLP